MIVAHYRANTHPFTKGVCSGFAPFSIFWDFLMNTKPEALMFYAGLMAGCAIFIWGISTYIMPGVDEWLHSIRPFIKQGVEDYKKWRMKKD